VKRPCVIQLSPGCICLAHKLQRSVTDAITQLLRSAFRGRPQSLGNRIDPSLGRPIAFTGLWEGFRWLDGAVPRAFAIITASANADITGRRRSPASSPYGWTIADHVDLLGETFQHNRSAAAVGYPHERTSACCRPAFKSRRSGFGQIEPSDERPVFCLAVAERTVATTHCDYWPHAGARAGAASAYGCAASWPERSPRPPQAGRSRTNLRTYPHVSRLDWSDPRPLPRSRSPWAKER
jgi:hypothetical protein